MHSTTNNREAKRWGGGRRDVIEVYAQHLLKHNWVDSWEDVSVDKKKVILLVRLNQPFLPKHVLKSDAYDVREVWVSTVPSRIARKFVGDRFLRNIGWGRKGLSMLVELPIPANDMGENDD